ncbi:DUF5412 domain-containing protein [Alkaliphilus sp. MSJ-5]|uniref:DUF5412 domain-containing protein n=1 Tax=Alkaliphilus flagellatus TaxID=2841507 RepID=A0ABS6G2C4_9FIRM|nr:DUF5412 family protein [Alkaliphilus flagellatus]MBU5675872.1 DUF5412 domain-containing protein [Alkaliphilus flagellatus]
MPHTVLILLSIVLSVIMLRNAIIALPLLFVLPMLAEKQSHIIVKCVSWITYIGICLFFCLIVLVRFGFARTYILSTEMSPDKKHSASIIVHDEGALGGSIEVQYERLYGGIIKKSRPIYIDRLSEPKIEWIDNYKIQIDDVIINIKDRDVIYRRK